MFFGKPHRFVIAGVLGWTCLAAIPTWVDAETRSIVVFGDTQTLVDGDPLSDDPLRTLQADHAGELPYLPAMVDWVQEQRETEKIDFVLHVGDAIQTGFARPKTLPDACVDPSVCDDFEIASEANQPAIQEDPCACAWRQRVDAEWLRFNAAWSRFDRVVPYGIVRGNHDNIGTADPGEPRGFADYYGSAAMRRLPGYLESSPGRDASHLWKFSIGAFPVLVLSIPHSWGDSATAVDWAREVIEKPEYRELPVILLIHQLFAGVPVDYGKPRRAWKELVEQSPERFFMEVWGHVSPGRARILNLGEQPNLDLRSNWQLYQFSPESSRMNLVRFHLDEDGIESIEVLSVSPLLETTTQVPLTSFPRRLRSGAPPASKSDDLPVANLPSPELLPQTR